MKILQDNQADRVRRLIESGLRAKEVAEFLHVSADVLSSFMQRHSIRLMANGNVPPPDLSREDRTIIFTSKTDPVSGAARIKRSSLPAITMHRDVLANRWGISQ